jgi:hypothetical protein
MTGIIEPAQVPGRSLLAVHHFCQLSHSCATMPHCSLTGDAALRDPLGDGVFFAEVGLGGDLYRARGVQSGSQSGGLSRAPGGKNARPEQPRFLDGKSSIADFQCGADIVPTRWLLLRLLWLYLIDKLGWGTRIRT